MRTLMLLIALFGLGTAIGQNATFTVEVSTDSLLLGNRLSVSFSLQHAQGEDFVFPQFEGLVKVSGPNVSSQMNVVNGRMSQRVTYTFYLEAHEVGDFYVEPASVKVGDTYLESDPVLVRVFPNPDGIIQPMGPTGGGLFGGEDLFGGGWMESGDFFDLDLLEGNPLFKGFFDNSDQIKKLLEDGGMFKDFFDGMSPYLAVPPGTEGQTPPAPKRKTTKI